MAYDEDDDALDSDQTDEPAEQEDSSKPVNPLVSEYLKNKQQLAQAQDQARQNHLFTGLARAGADLSAGLARSNRPVDESSFNEMDKAADQPVADAIKGQGEVLKPLELEEKFKNDQAMLAQKDQDRAAWQSAQLASRTEQEKDRNQAKRDVDQAKAYTAARKDLETFRGNKAAGQAALDVLNANKAVALVANKDPNTLTTQDLTLLSDEMAKIATGGVPGEHGVQALMPDNLKTKLAEFQNFIMSKPTNAQAGEYVKHNMAYLKDMVGAAQGTVDNYRRNILKGYRSRLHTDDYQEALDDYQLGDKPPSSSSNVKDAVAQELQRRNAQRASASLDLSVPGITGVPQSLQPNSYAYGGPVQPSYHQVKMPIVQPFRPAAVHMPAAPKTMVPVGTSHLSKPMYAHGGQVCYACGGAVHSYEKGGQVPGKAPHPFETYANDVVGAKLTPGEEVLPLHVTQAKDPALAAYIYMKQKGK